MRIPIILIVQWLTVSRYRQPRKPDSGLQLQNIASAVAKTLFSESRYETLRDCKILHRDEVACYLDGVCNVDNLRDHNTCGEYKTIRLT